MVSSIKEVYLKNLTALINEITLYSTEEDIWKIAPGIANSGGNLVLHLIGNLNYFIGTFLGNTGFVRDRDREFSDKNIPKQTLLADLTATTEMVISVIESLPEDDMEKLYPTDKFGEGKTIGYALVYLLAHLNYHLGQLNYHRRLIGN
ncbi:MAG: DinB family protein [Chitinophagales bacterium]